MDGKESFLVDGVQSGWSTMKYVVGVGSQDVHAGGRGSKAMFLWGSNSYAAGKGVHRRII